MERLKLGLKTLLLLFCLVVSTATTATSGVLEINQLCVATGCFAGDGPGWPVEITEPGSYRLTSNLTITSQGQPLDGIHVLSSEVSLDLGGFSIDGPVVCTGDLPSCTTSDVEFGIRAIQQPGQIFRNITISNGTIEGFDLDCISLEATHFELSKLQITGCGRHGIGAAQFSGIRGRIDRVNAIENGLSGAFVTFYSFITNSAFINNGGYGVQGGICDGNVFSLNGDRGQGSLEEEACSYLQGNNFCRFQPC